MDYFAIVHKVIKKNIKKNFELKADKSNIIVKASQNSKQDAKKFSNLNDQIDFIVFFPNLINYLTGKSPYLSDKKINQDLSIKYDREIIETIEKFKSFNSCNDLKSFVIINTSKYKLVDNIRNYVATIHFDESEKIYAKKYSKNEKQKINIEINDLAGFAELFNKNITQLHPFENYKENFYTNCNDFNKKLFSEYFLSKSRSSIFWRNEIPINFKWENIKKIDRIREAENHNNSSIRSLIISSLLRCIYPILNSYSKNIRKKFIEILFSNNIYYEFFLYISSGLYSKFNIGEKILNIFQVIFGINFCYVKEQFKNLNPNNDKSEENNFNENINNNISSRNKNYYKDIIGHIKKDKQITDNDLKYYLKLLEIISISTIFIKRIYSIHFVEKYHQNISNHDFIQVFIIAINQILNNISNCNFPDFFKESIEILIVNNLLKNNFIKNILQFYAINCNLNEKVSKIIYKKILMKNYYSQNIDIKSIAEIEDKIIYYLLSFKFYLQKNTTILINTISNLKFLCKENKHMFLKEIIYFDMNDFSKQIKYKFSKDHTYKKKNTIENDENKYKINVKNLEVENEKKLRKVIKPNTKLFDYLDYKKSEYSNNTTDQKEKNENLKILKEIFVKKIFDEYKIIDFSIEIQNNHFPEETRIVSNICEVDFINDKDRRKTLNLFILTNLHVYIFELDKDEYILKNNNIAIAKESKYLKFKLDEFLDIKYFDYKTRLIFEYQRMPNIKNVKEQIKKMEKRIKLKKTIEEELILESQKANPNFSTLLNTKINKRETITKEESQYSKINKESTINISDLHKEIQDLNNNESNNNYLINNIGLINIINSEEEKPYSLFFSVSFKTIFESVKIFNLINDDNHKLKTKSNSTNTFFNILEKYIFMHEKKKDDISPKNIDIKRITNYEKSLQTKKEEDINIPIFLEDIFKNEEYEFLKNEFKIKNFLNNKNEDMDIMMRKIRAFEISYQSSKISFNIFERSEYNNNICKNRKILYFGKECFFILEENFSLIDIEKFVNLDYSDTDNESFNIIHEIEYKDVRGIEMKNDALIIDYTIGLPKIIFNLTTLDETEIVYFYFMMRIMKYIK